MAAVAAADAALFRRLLRLARPYWLAILGVFAISLASTPLALLQPYPVKIAVDSVVGSQPLPGVLQAVAPEWLTASRAGRLGLAALLLLLVALLAHGAVILHSILRTYAAEKLMLDFRSRLFAHAQRLSLSYHDSKGTADALYRIQHDAPCIEYVLIDSVIPFVAAASTLAGMLYVTLRMDTGLALVGLSLSPILFWIAQARRRRLRTYWQDIKGVESRTQSVLQEALTSVRVVKAFVQEDREHARFVRHADEGFRQRLRMAVADGGYALIVGLTAAAGTAVVVFVGVRHVLAGSLSLGSLLLVIAYLNRLQEPLLTMAKQAAGLQGHLVGAERAFALLDEAPEVPERHGARALRRAQGGVVFDAVGFAYEPGRPVLRGISFQALPGTSIGLRGATGAGKTTLMNLLTRFYDPTSGRILLDGVDLRDYRVADLRNQFAIVLQEPVLFSSSIAENIAYAQPGAPLEKIVAAAEAAHAHEFIAALPEGYDTLVGERGMRLSGGERQRIALARAFLKDAPILILDEPTSSVDGITESKILDAMRRLMQGRTTFMIAHRLNTLEHCDQRFQIEGGLLAEARPANLALPGLRRS